MMKITIMPLIKKINKNAQQAFVVQNQETADKKKLGN